MDDTRWPAEWLRGALGLCVLGVLAGGPTYGYAISRRLAEAGLGAVQGGTLYPLLARLEKDGLVESSWQAGDAGPGRKYFALTEAGRAELAERSRQWERFVGVTRQVLSTTQEAT
ncbi:PadR family transcriptional regulator [Actinoplanes sp. NBC_00393]|uniref:PadR family transcriptional regulator n=1 Tax=Actinoplanes sp. NBC_00393 TaxID=2975953 RepID=UPI002E22FE30